MTSSHGETGNGPSITTAGLEMFGQFQATTRQLLEFQQSQQRMIERYLDTQERVLAHCLQGASLTPIAIAAPVALPAIAAPVAFAPPAPPIAVAPIAAPPVAVPSAAATPRAVAAPAAARPPVAVPNLAAPKPAIAPTTVAAAPVAPAPASQNGQHTSKPAAPVAEAAGGPPTTDEFRNDLLEIVSERTGYPVDMLDETLPLEAGLGIDSIKTVEIFSNLKKYHDYFADEDQDEEEQLVEFTKLKTLKDIINSYDRRRTAILSKSAGAAKPSQPATNGAPHTNGQANGQVDRYALTAAEAPLEVAGQKKNSLSDN